MTIRTIPPNVLAPNKDELSMGTPGPFKIFLKKSYAVRRKHSKSVRANDRRSWVGWESRREVSTGS